MKLHVDADTAKGDALHLQTESLFGRAFAWYFDGSAGAHDAMPRQPGDLPQDAHDLAGRARPPCGSSQGPVRRDATFR